MNKVILVGVVERNAQCKTLDTGISVANFTVITSDSYTNKQGEPKETRHLQAVILWGKTAPAIAEQATKGTLVSVHGKLQNRKWTDNAGQEHWVTEVAADRFDGVKILSAGQNQKAASQSGSASGSRATSGEASAAPGDDEVPF